MDESTNIKKELAGPKIIPVGNEKGGSAKTTTAFQLAVDLKLMGYQVALIDNDPQKGSVRWKQGMTDPSKAPLIVPVENPLMESDLEFAKTLDFVVIDGAPGFGNDKRLSDCHNYLNSLLYVDDIPESSKQDIRTTLRKIFGFNGTIAAKNTAMANLADLFIVPCIASIQDIEPTVGLIENLILPRLHQKLDYRVLLTSSSDSTQLYKSTRNTLQGRDIKMFDTSIASREIYRKASTYGFTVLDNTSDPKATQETHALTLEVLAYFGMN